MAQKSIFITGAASGIGACTARRFTGAGWRVGIYDLNASAAEELARELGEGCRAGSIDVTDWDSVQAALDDFAVFTGGALDVLCNNAGLFQDRAFVESDYSFLRKMIQVNTEGVVACAMAAFPMLAATPGAKLINMGSASSIYGVPNAAVYSSTKFFVRGFSEALACEWEAHDIAVSVIMPSYVDTPMTENTHLSFASDSSAILSTEDVSEAVWRAVHSNRLYWILPKSARIQSFLVRLTPLSLLHWLTGRMFKRSAIR